MSQRYCKQCKKSTTHRVTVKNDASGLERIGFAVFTLGVTELLLTTQYSECHECGNTIEE